VETENLILAGTGVNVIFENGTIIPAQIDSCLDGQLTVSFEDKNYEPGTHVMIQSEEGEILGSGVLVIRDPLRLMAAEGVVSRVAVSEGQRVDINDVLLELTDAGKSAEYDSLYAQRLEQEDLLQTLITLHYTGVVTAPCDGVISGIKENCPALLHQKAQGEDDLPDSLSPELLTQLEQKNTDLFIAAVTPQQWVTVTITVDEQDVLRLKPGMEAVVRIPALSEDIITATVKEVSAEGKNQGGSSKFSVKLKLPHGEKMLAGMNVTVSIPVETVTDVKQIPVAAVVNLGSKTVGYRGYDGDKETFTDPVEVVLGRSDGIYVEVISGLDAGEVFYYGYYDTLELSDEPDFGVLPFAGH
jgi:multidrug efflux pump subunit AcrA (membrane-fusion protein)